MESALKEKNILPRGADNLFFNSLYSEKTLPHDILEESNFNFRYIWLRDLHIPRAKWLLFVNSGDPDQTLHSAVSDLGLCCLQLPVQSLLK